MTQADNGEAFGAPGIEPRWTHGNKNGIGTAYSASSKIWFSLFEGIVTEVYFPTVDRPQLRDVQFLISDGATFVHEEKRDLQAVVHRLSGPTLGFQCVNTDRSGRYSVSKDVIADPELPCLLQRVRLVGADSAFLDRLRVYVLCAPHLEVGGSGNNGYLKTLNGRRVLLAHKGAVWMAVTTTAPIIKASCGFVGRSDGFTDLHENMRMTHEFERATNGNIALTAELSLDTSRELTLGLAFGDSEHRAVTNLFQSLGVPFAEQRTKYVAQWEETVARRQPLETSSYDGGNLFSSSFSLLLAHEDKSYLGAIIASLAIPWGEAKGDEDGEGGYHLVWTRDMVNSATALLAAGDKATPLRALIFLSVSQHDDGGFAQNFWVNGESYWTGIQLDEVAFPILLAFRLFTDIALGDFDPGEMVRRAASYLVRHGPVTQQERWEEASGYSPSTLASNIAALICAATMFRRRGNEDSARFVEEYADYLEAHIEAWTATREGTLHPSIKEYYIRILPENVGAEHPAEDPEARTLQIKNLPADVPSEFPAKNVVDGGFLELVRYGIRSAKDRLIVDTVAVIDEVLKTETAVCPVWHRYNHDGYGQGEKGEPFLTVGRGRAWPLLTGERGHYELAAGRSTETYLRALEGFASPTGLLPEQVWDEPDRPELYLFLGKPTGSAMPLMWAHAEYVKLLRSSVDGVVYDLVPEVRDRYLASKRSKSRLEIWKLERRVRFIAEGSTLRILADEPFRLRWSADGWGSQTDSLSGTTALEIHYLDLPVSATASQGTLRFTFYWLSRGSWQGEDFSVDVA